MTKTCCLRRRGQLRRRGLEKLVQRLDRLRTAAILDVVDEAHERVDGRRRNTLLTRKRADSADLRVDLSLALAHRKSRHTPVCVFAFGRLKASMGRIESTATASV